MIESFINLLIRYFLPIVVTIGAFFAIWIKKFLERTADLAAEDWYKKRKEK